MPLAAIFFLLALIGLALALGAWFGIRAGGAQPGLARRLAGPPEVAVGSLVDGGVLPDRPIRVKGRVRCRDPLEAGDGELLVAFHRDIEVLVGNRWRTIERLRETRSFELWDHDGSLTVDPARAAEPLVSIPKVWRGDPAELEEPHRSAVRRLVEAGETPTRARSTVRTLNLTDRLLVLARPVRDDAGQVWLQPPPGGFVVTNLALPDAMRLLGGRRRRVAALSVIGLALGVVLVAVGVVGAVLATSLA